MAVVPVAYARASFLHLGEIHMKHPLIFVLGCAGLSTLLAPGTASAGFSDCGNIHVEANAMCQLEVEGGCEAHCTPVSVQASCDAVAQTCCGLRARLAPSFLPAFQAGFPFAPGSCSDCPMVPSCFGHVGRRENWSGSQP